MWIPFSDETFFSVNILDQRNPPNQKLFCESGRAAFHVLAVVSGAASCLAEVVLGVVLLIRAVDRRSFGGSTPVAALIFGISCSQNAAPADLALGGISA